MKNETVDMFTNAGFGNVGVGTTSPYNTLTVIGSVGISGSLNASSINTTAEHPYLVKLYSKEECDKYANDVWNREPDKFNFYCTRWVEVKDLKEGMRIAVPKSKYSERHSNVQSSPFNNLSINSAVVYTLTSDCCLRCGSLDQTAALIANANAMYGESSLSGRAEIDFSSNSSYSEWLQNLILSSISFCHSSNSCSESFDLNKHSDLCLSISDSMYSGAKNLALSMKNKYEAAESGFIMENFTFASNTSLIISPYLFINFALTSGESLASKDLNASFLTFLPNSTDHSVNSFSSLDSSLLRNSSNSGFLCSLALNSSIMECISLSTPSNLFTINESILASQNTQNKDNYLNFAESDITFEKIASIKTLPPQHVYDLSIEGTRNFIANDIVAHNTYLATSSGNVGIGTTSPYNTLTVIGSVGVSGSLNASSIINEINKNVILLHKNML